MDALDVVVKIRDILAQIVPVLIAFALAYFIWGVIKYITAGDSEEGRKNARNTIVYGVIGLFAIVAVWGLVAIIIETFEVDETSPGALPQYDFRGSNPGGNNPGPSGPPSGP